MKRTRTFCNHCGQQRSIRGRVGPPRVHGPTARRCTGSGSRDWRILEQERQRIQTSTGKRMRWVTTREIPNR